MVRLPVWSRPCIHSQLLPKGFPRWSHWQWEEVVEEIAAITLSPDCSPALWTSYAISMEVTVAYAFEDTCWFGKTKLKYFKVLARNSTHSTCPKKDVSSFCKLLANKDWGTSQWICLVEEIKAKSVNWSLNLRWLSHVHDYLLTTKVRMQHLMKLSTEPSNI